MAVAVVVAVMVAVAVVVVTTAAAYPLSMTTAGRSLILLPAVTDTRDDPARAADWRMDSHSARAQRTKRWPKPLQR